MKKTTNILLTFLVLFAYSCDDIIEEDISNDTILTISPVEGAVIEGNTAQFFWQTIDGADNYRIQVMSSNQALVVDSLVTTTNLGLVLNPGDYQWRIKGENFAYATEYTFPINFTMVTSDDLTNQTVELLTPSGNFYTNETNLILTWSPIVTADSYSLDVIKINGGEQTILQETNLEQPNYSLSSLTLSEDAEYTWKIKAVNQISESAFSERSIFIDRETPGQPALVAPIDLEIFDTFTILFNWINGSESGNIQSTKINTFEISTDINFGSIIFSEAISNNSIQVTFDNSGTYYWRVRTSDEAGNVGPYSAVRTLDIL
jgi:hypothetical protein